MSDTPYDDIVALHAKAKKMYEKPEEYTVKEVIKLQMDTLDALERIVKKFSAYL